MGTIEKRGKNSWRISTQIKVAGQWQWVRTTLKMDPALSEAVQRRDAQRELDLLEKRLAGSAAEIYTLREWSEIWLTRHLDMDASPVTVSNYRYLLNSRILPALGDKLLQELTPALLTDWLYNLRNEKRKSTRLPDDQLSRPRRKNEKLAPPSKVSTPLSAKTALNYYGCMKTMLAAAVRMGHIEYNPMERVNRPKQKRKTLPNVSEGRAIALLHLILTEAPRPLQLSVLLAILCSLRLGEVCALEYKDINANIKWTSGTLTVSRAMKYTPNTGTYIDAPKTDSGIRVITLPPSVLQILHAARWEDITNAIDDPDHYYDHAYIIHNRRGERVNKDTPSKWFRAFADAHGFQDITFHDLRHIHASILVANNIDIAAIAARMGHSDPSVTLSVYTHALQPRDQDAADTLERLLSAAIHIDDDPSADSNAN